MGVTSHTARFLVSPGRVQGDAAGEGDSKWEKGSVHNKEPQHGIEPPSTIPTLLNNTCTQVSLADDSHYSDKPM